jgi:GT2 family glycosyltransferase
MTLSVIIVSYNVKHFLEQCLCSVQRALANDMEVFVVDNHSTDGSVEYCQQRFPFARFILNKENVGFGKANNQALPEATGKYVLFLNPDTIIPEDLFTLCISFMGSHADAGALDVRMIDGSGAFLKESKRGFPSPWVAFCKMSGLTKLFPRSSSFARYYMGHLPEKKINEVDALAGACMFLRKEVLDKVGGFDERFFMYAEDIDLSYRIQQAGYKNYYFPETAIIHFKGESTRKDKKYIKYFYKAMIQFVRKHFVGGSSGLYIIMLEAAIKVRAGIAGVFSNPGNNKATLAGRILLVGEPMVTRKLATRFSGNKDLSFLVYQNDNNALKAELKSAVAGTIIFCESKTFSFKNIIEVIDNIKLKSELRISASDSDCVVGSSSNSTQGSSVGLENS